MTNKEKFELIDVSKLPSEQKSIVEKTRSATNNFTVTDERINTAIGKGLDNIIAKLREKNPEALKDFKAPEPPPPAPEPKAPKAKKTPVKKTTTKKAKAVTTTPEPSKPKNGLMIKAKEIRKEGETWEQAVKRASEILKEDKAKANEVVKTEMQKLLALVRRRKELKGITGTNIPRDAKRTALPRGKRISKDGNTYYENRDNRTDRLAPNYPKNLPLLADGGELEGKLMLEIGVPYNYEKVVENKFEFTEFLSKTLTKKWFGNGVWAVKIVKPLFDKNYGQKIVVEIDIPLGVTQNKGIDKFEFTEFLSKTLTKKWFGNGVWSVDVVSDENFADGGELDSHTKEVEFLKTKGFSNITSSDKDSDLVFGDGDEVIFASQGQKNDSYAVAYFYNNDNNGVSSISKEILNDIASQFRGSKVELFTNAGVDLHSTERNQYKNIIVRKVPYDNFDKFAKGGSVKSKKQYSLVEIPAFNSNNERAGNWYRIYDQNKHLQTLFLRKRLNSEQKYSITEVSDKNLAERILKEFQDGTHNPEKIVEGSSSNYADGGSLKENLENQLAYYKNLLKNIDKYPDYNKNNVETIIKELEYKLTENGELKSVVDAIFDYNEKRGKINTGFGAKTKEGLTAMIENKNYSSEEITKAIFYSNEKKERISTDWGVKSFFGLQEMIERASGKFEDGGSILMNSMYKKGGLLSPVERYKEELKGLTGLSKTAINDFIVDYNITESELLNIVIGLGRKQISRADVVTAIVGDKGNSYMADVLAFAKSNTALKAEDGIDLTDDNRLRVQAPAIPKRKLSKQELTEKFNASAFEFMTDDEDDVAKAELGANLAGWSGTRFGIGTPQTDLDGFTGTSYSGLVGETGAMSSGELFEGGGDTNERLYNFLVDDLNKLETAVSDNDTEQIEIFFSYWLGSSGHLNSLKPKTNERLYNFLVDDLNKLETAIADGNTEETDKFFSYWLGDEGHLKSLKMANGGFMAKGGMIVYLDGEKSKSFKTKKSLYEFVRNQTNTGVKKVEIDYGNRIIPTFDTYLIEEGKLVHKGELIQKNYNKEEAEARRLETERNINKMMGFANGGQFDSSIIDELWKGYATAILFTEVDMDTDEPLENEYSISDFDEETVRSSKMMLSNFYIKNKDSIEESELDLDTIGNDIWYTQSGQGAGFFDHSLDDDIEKKLISGAKAFGESPSVENYEGKISVRLGRVMNDYAEGGAINGSLNKKIQKLAQSKGLTFDKLGKDEYNLVMTQALVESLTDANFHQEAKEVVVKAEGKTKWSDDLYKSVYFNPEEKIGSFAREVARHCEWTGDDIINAYFFTTKMEGSKVAGMIEELFLQPKPKNPNDFTPTVKFEVGDIVWDKGNESYGTVMNVYGDPIEGASGEIRLDSDGNQSIFTFDKDWNISGYNLNKLGSKGDEGSFYKIVLDEMKASANRLIASRKESKDKDGVAYYQEVYKRLLDGEFDSMVIKDTAPKKYIKHDDIKNITVMYKGKQTTFKAEDVLNGANLLADGGELQKKAFYIAKRDVVSVELKSGETVKPVNGYWIKKDAEPLSTPSAPSTNKEEMPFEDWLTKNNISVYKRTYYWVADDGGKDYMYSGTKAEVMKSLKEDWKQKKSFAKGGEVNPNRHTYMMLSRLQMDNEYFLNHGNRSERHLWAGNVTDQIAEMKKLWNELPENQKPEWLNMNDILEYERKMKDEYAKGGFITKIKIKDWYIKTYPTDDLGEEISDASFEDLWNALHKNKNVYDIIGVGDSLVRERLFEHLSEMKGVQYNEIYNKWLETDEYATGGSIPNNYEGRTAEEVWEKWSAKQRLHFLEDHFLSNSEYKQSDINQIYETKYYDWNDLPHLAQQEIKRHVGKGQYAKGGSLGKSLYVEYSSWFNSNKYNVDKIKTALESIGAKNIRVENAYGWSNQPEVVVFNGNEAQATEALQKAFDTEWIIISEKDWRTKKIAKGGAVKNINGEEYLEGYEVEYFKTKFKGHVYANISIPSENPTFEDELQIKGFGQTETDAYNDLKNQYELYLKNKETKPSDAIGFSEGKFFAWGGEIKNKYKTYDDFVKQNIGSQKFVITVGNGGQSQPFDGAIEESIDKQFKSLVFHNFKDYEFSANYMSENLLEEYNSFIEKFYNSLIENPKEFVEFWNNFIIESGHYDSLYTIRPSIYDENGKYIESRDWVNNAWVKNHIPHYPDLVFAKYKKEMSAQLIKEYQNYLDEYAGEKIGYNFADGGDVAIANLNKNTEIRDQMISYIVNMKSSSKMSEKQYEALEKRTSEKSFAQLKKEYDLLKENKLEDGGMTLSNSEIIKDLVFEDNTDMQHGRYDFYFNTVDSEGASILDYDGYIIESPTNSRRDCEIEWGQNIPEDWEQAETIIQNAFADYKLNNFAQGGAFEKTKWQDVEVGDSAIVKELGRMGLIIKTYGRKFHLKFPNGTEKTFDASDLDFYKLEKDEYEIDNNNNYASGGEIYTHKHSKNWGENISIELLEPTAKGWKVKQTTKKGRKTATKTAFFSSAEIKELFNKVSDSSFAYGGEIENYRTLSFKTRATAEKAKKDIDSHFAERVLNSTISNGIDERGNDGFFVEYNLKKENYADGGSLPEKIKIKDITLSTYDHSVFAKNLQSFEKANEVIYFVWKSGRYSNVRYKLEYQDGETIEGVIDIEPKSFHAPHKNNILSWHLKTYWGNVAKSPALPYLPQSYIDEAKEIVAKYAFDDSNNFEEGGKVNKRETQVQGYIKSNGEPYYFSSHSKGLDDLMMYEKIDVIQLNDYDGGRDFFLGYGTKSRVSGISDKKSDGRLFFGKWNGGFVSNENYPKGNMLGRHKINYADGGDINAFSMKLTKGTANSPDIITTQEQEVNFANGGRIRDRKYLNHSEDYEVNYAKGKNRHGYGNLSFAEGGTLNVHDSTAFFDTMYAKGGATTKTYKKGDKVTTEFGTYYVNGADAELQKVIDRNKSEMQESALAKLGVNFVNAKYFTEDNDVAPQMRSWFDDKKQPTEAQVKNAMIWSYDSYGDYQIKAGGGSKSDNIFVSHLRSTIADPVTGNDKDVVILKKYSNNFKDVLITIKEVEALQKLTESSKVRESRRKDNFRGAIGFLYRCELLGKYADSNGTEVPAERIEEMYQTTRDHASESEINEQIDHIIKVRTDDAHNDYMEDTPEKIAKREVTLQKQIKALEVVRKRLLGKSSVADEAKTEKTETTHDSSKKYILKTDIATVTVNKNGKSLVYPASAVFNGANLLADGGDLQKKANYIPKRDVISVQLKNGETVKPANGYWIKKDAKPVGDDKPSADEIKFSITTINKGFNGWKAKTNVDNLKGYDWEIVTMKNSKGELDSHARGGHSTDKGTHSIFTFTLYQDPFKTLIRTTPSRITDKVVSAQHDKALEEFKKYIETDKFEAGGETTFAEKSSAIAKNFVGQKVEPKYQKEYGKEYSKAEAKEVGNKIAGAQKAKYDKAHASSKKMFFGGFSGKKPSLVDKQFETITGDYVQVLSQDDSKKQVKVFRVDQLGLGVEPHTIPISELIIPTDEEMEKGGTVKKPRKEGSGNPLLAQAVIKAREIRRSDETWKQAMKRAYAIVKQK